MKFTDLRPGMRIQGVGMGIVTVLRAELHGETGVTLTYEDDAGALARVLLLPPDEARLQEAGVGPTWSFDGDPDAFLLATEAERIRLAHLFDPFVAVHTSRIEPLPHQIQAVYGDMLDRHPLRFLLADDPGAGKTIMAGLLIKELFLRGDLERCLVVAPGALVEQWQDELGEKFDLDFTILTRDRLEASRSGNPFTEQDLWIARLDMLSRREDLKSLIEEAKEWDLVVCDEAHRMSASFFGGDVKYTKRYQLGRLLRERTRHFLLMTATPHNGKEEDFQLFLALLDPDRFEGRFRPGVHSTDARDTLRRLTKEELRRFDGAPLFPERRAYTVQYDLSDAENDLYEAVTRYVQDEMNRAERFAARDDKRRVNVGFALTVLQRRLASSPAAIHESLKRRLNRMEDRLAMAQEAAEGGEPDSRPLAFSDPDWDPEALEDANESEIEATEESVLDLATAAGTIEELRTEIGTLRLLEQKAAAVRRLGTDRKWTELNGILDDPLMTDEAGVRRKLIVFTEPRDTLEYLADRIRIRLGRHDAVVVIHGGVSREARRHAVDAFMNDPEVVVMVANDAAGEGVNLQRAHLMVNYDLPWNPNRLEQRFGRIHRIGQTEVCHLWNLVARETREGAVYGRLLEKLDTARKALGGRVYDVLGRLFQGNAMRDLLLEAIRYGERPEVKARLFETLDEAAELGRIENLLAENSLLREHLSPATVQEIRDQMDRANARRLQPHFIRRFFVTAFKGLGGGIRKREAGRFEITRVPGVVRDRARRPGRTSVLQPRYERVCFDRQHESGPPPAAFVAPGHPLLDHTLDAVLDQHRGALRDGAVLVDEADDGEALRALFVLESVVTDGQPTSTNSRCTISQRLAFCEVSASGAVAGAGPAPHLDLRAIRSEEREVLGDRVQAPRLTDDQIITQHAVSVLAPAHLEEIRERRRAEIQKTRGQVRARLMRERTHWDNKANELRIRERAGKPGRLAAAQAARRAEELDDRLRRRMAELDREEDIAAAPPRIVGGALVVPAGLLRRLSTSPEWPAEVRSASADSRAEVERIAMETVMQAEQNLGREPRDVSADKCGYDIESRDPTSRRLRFIEVKGRRADAATVTVTRNETMVALNSRDRPHDYILAIVLVEHGYAKRTAYVTDPFRTGVDDTAETVTHNLKRLLSRARPPG